MSNLSNSFDAVVDPDLWEQAAGVGAGYTGASLAQTVGEGVTPFDLPNEVYGVGVAYAGYTFAPAYQSEIAAGGAAYTLDALAQRVGLKSAVTNMAGVTDHVNVVEGTATDPVTTHQNATGAARATPILEVSPARGTFLRFLNYVEAGGDVLGR